MSSLRRTSKAPRLLKNNRYSPPSIAPFELRQPNPGNVFEKHLLEAHLAEQGTDPVTDTPATVEDYVELKGTPPFSLF